MPKRQRDGPRRRVNPAVAEFSQTRPGGGNAPTEAGRYAYALWCFETSAADPRQHVAEIPASTACGCRGRAAAPNSRIASRPPGRSTRAHLGAARAPARSTLRMPNAIVTASHERVAHRDRASRRRAPAGCARSSAARAQLARARARSIAPAKSTPTTDAPRRARARPRSRGRAVPVQRSSTRSPAGQRSASTARVAPAAIEAGAEQMIEEVVARGDRVEHARDARRASCRAVESSAGFADASRRGSCPVHGGIQLVLEAERRLRILPAMKSARSSSVFGSW